MTQIQTDCENPSHTQEHYSVNPKLETWNRETSGPHSSPGRHPALILYPTKWTSRKPSYVPVTLKKDMRDEIRTFFGTEPLIGGFVIGELLNLNHNPACSAITPLKLGRRFTLSINNTLLRYLHYQPEDTFLLKINRLIPPEKVGTIKNGIEYVGKIMRWDHALVHHIPQQIRELVGVPQSGSIELRLGTKLYYRRISSQYRITIPAGALSNLEPGNVITRQITFLQVNPDSKKMLRYIKNQRRAFWQRFDKIAGHHISCDPSSGKPSLLLEVLKDLIEEDLIPNVEDVIQTEEYVTPRCRLDMVVRLKDGSKECWELKAHRIAHEHDLKARDRLVKYKTKGIPLTVVITLPESEVPSWIQKYSEKLITLENLMKYAQNSNSDSAKKKLELIRTQWPEFK